MLHSACYCHYLTESRPRQVYSVSLWAASMLSFSSPPSPSPSCGSRRLPYRDGKIWGGFPFRGSGNQLTQKEAVSTQTCQRSILGTSSFLENLWGFLRYTSLPTRTEAGWLEREGKCEFPASGQLQITHLWFPETSSLSIYFCRETKSC